MDRSRTVRISFSSGIGKVSSSDDLYGKTKIIAEIFASDTIWNWKRLHSGSSLASSSCVSKKAIDVVRRARLRRMSPGLEFKFLGYSSAKAKEDSQLGSIGLGLRRSLQSINVFRLLRSLLHLAIFSLFSYLSIRCKTRTRPNRLTR